MNSEFERDNNNQPKNAKAADKQQVAFSVRTYRVSIVACLLILLTVLIGHFFVYLVFQNFVSNNDRFFFEGVEYAFTSDDKSAYGVIAVVGHDGRTQDIVIPQKIYNHNVVAIAPSAFQDSSIQTLQIFASVSIQEKTFENIDTLHSVTLENVTSIGDFAFSRCDSLFAFSATNLKKIGKSAFENCDNLSSVSISQGSQLLQIGRDAFYDCNNLNVLEIDQFVDYTHNTSFLRNCVQLRSLKLKNFNCDSAQMTNTDSQTIHQLFGSAYDVFSSQASNLNRLEIEYCGSIPPNFCYGLPLFEVTLKNLASTEICDQAFFDCSNLTLLNLPHAMTKVGNKAFAQTSIVTFNGEKLQSIGEQAFLKCYNLQTFELEKNTQLDKISTRAFEHCTSLESILLPASVRQIGDSAFQNCQNLASVNFPQGLTSIGNNAFEYCTKLQTIEVPASVQQIGFGAFSACGSLLKINLPFVGPNAQTTTNSYFAYVFGATDPLFDSVPQSLKQVVIMRADTIADKAFFNCSSIEEIVVQSNFSSIGNNAFANCKSLKTFVIPSSVDKIGTEAFYNCYKLHEIYNLSSLNIVADSTSHGGAGNFALNVHKTLGEQADRATSDGFEFVKAQNGKWYLVGYNGQSTTLNFPQGFQYNGLAVADYQVVKYCFVDNSDLKQVNVTSAVKQIGEYAFSGCQQLTSVNIQQGSGTIGRYAFGSCLSLVQVYIAKGVENIEWGVFFNCENIEQMTLPFVGKDRLDTQPFGYIYGTTDNDIPQMLREVTILDAVNIAQEAFSQCHTIEAINLPNNVESIGRWAFLDCYMLEQINLPEGVTIVDEWAFLGCYNLREVTFPTTLQTVGVGAFLNCELLQSVTIKSAVAINYDAFRNCFMLHDVYNFGGLSLSVGQEDNGFLAYYAIAVHTTKDSFVEQVVIDGVVFKHFGNLWAVVGYVGTQENLVLGRFEYGGKTIENYTVKNRAFYHIGGRLTSLTVGKEVAVIEQEAFARIYGLTTVDMSNSTVTQLNSGTFWHCQQLQEIVLPKGLTHISSEAFASCIRLASITLPQTLVQIDNWAFADCFSLYEVTNLSNTLVIQRGSEENGRVAYWALRVNTSEQTVPLQKFEYDGFEFTLLESQLCLIGIVGFYHSDLVLPRSVEHDGIVYSTYVLWESTFPPKGFESITIPNTVSQIVSIGNSWHYTDHIIFDGTQAQWNVLTANLQNSYLLEVEVEFTKK